MILGKDHAQTIVRVKDAKVVTVPKDTFTAGQTVILFNETNDIITLESKVETTYISGHSNPRTMIEFPPKMLVTLLFLDDQTAVVTREMS